jgi:hypothetical protein
MWLALALASAYINSRARAIALSFSLINSSYYNNLLNHYIYKLGPWHYPLIYFLLNKLIRYKSCENCNSYIINKINACKDNIK